MILYFLGIRLTIFSILEQTRYINHGKLIPAMTVNEMKWTMGFYAIFVYILAKLGQENLLRMVRWHCPPDTGLEIGALAVWGRARYFSVTEAPHNIASLRVSGEEKFCVFETWGPKWGSNPRSPTFQTGNFRDNQDNQGWVKRSRTTKDGSNPIAVDVWIYAMVKIGRWCGGSAAENGPWAPFQLKTKPYSPALVPCVGRCWIPCGPTTQHHFPIRFLGLLISLSAQYWIKAGPPSPTLAQLWFKIGQTPRVEWILWHTGSPSGVILIIN